MAYLESRNVVHRDLAARNVLIHNDGTAKVRLYMAMFFATLTIFSISCIYCQYDGYIM